MNLLPRSRRRSALVAAAVALTACSGHGHARGSPSGSPSPTASHQALPSERFVYRVDDRSGPKPVVTTLEVDAASPYVARVVTRAGAPPGGRFLGGTAWGEAGVVELAADGTARQVEQSPPGFTGGDSHLDLALPLAQQLGWARRLGSAQVAGHACVRWLTGPPLDSGTIAAASATERTTSCVDATGRLVADTWERNGRVIRVRQLADTSPGPALSVNGTTQGLVPSPIPTTSAAQLSRPVPAAKLAQLMGVAVPPAPTGMRPDRSVASVHVDTGGTATSESATFTFVGAGRLAVVTFTRYLNGAPTAPTQGLAVSVHGARWRVTPVVYGLRAETVSAAKVDVVVAADVTRAQLIGWLDRIAVH